MPSTRAATGEGGEGSDCMDLTLEFWAVAWRAAQAAGGSSPCAAGCM